MSIFYFGNFKEGIKHAQALLSNKTLRNHTVCTITSFHKTIITNCQYFITAKMSLEKDRRSQGSGSQDTPNKLSAITQASHKASSPFPRIINKFTSRPTTFKKKNLPNQADFWLKFCTFRSSYYWTSKDINQSLCLYKTVGRKQSYICYYIYKLNIF